MNEYTDSLTIEGVPLTIVWHIDVDSPQIDAVYVDDGAGDDIEPLLSIVAKSKINRFLGRRMDEMAKEAGEDREIEDWRHRHA